MKPRESWSRRKGETARAFMAFCKYRDRPPHKRSLIKVFGDHKGYVSGNITRWSKANEWVARATEHDDHLDRIMRLETEGSLKEALRDHASIAKQAIEEVEQKFIRLMAELPPGIEALNALAVAGLAMRRWSDVQLRGLGYLPPIDDRGIVDGDALATNLTRMKGKENVRV